MDCYLLVVCDFAGLVLGGLGGFDLYLLFAGLCCLRFEVVGL